MNIKEHPKNELEKMIAFRFKSYIVLSIHKILKALNNEKENPLPKKAISFVNCGDTNKVSNHIPWAT